MNKLLLLITAVTIICAVTGTLPGCVSETNTETEISLDSVKPYENVFGQSGFYIVCTRGAAYKAYDYYYFDSDKTLKLLIQCSNYIIENDVNDDGQKELLWFYHGYPNDDGSSMATYCYRYGGLLYVTEIDELLSSAFPDITFPGIYTISSADNSTLYFSYSLNGEDNLSHRFEIGFKSGCLTIKRVSII